MPDEYYADMEASIDATSISDRRTMSHLGYMVGRPAEMWEWFAGSGRLSAAARASGVSHLPPLDYRWGVDLGEISTQIRVLWTFLVYGCEVLFAAPTCTPWGANARGWPSDKRTAQRTHQRPALQFLAAVCFTTATWPDIHHREPQRIRHLEGLSVR